MSARRLCGWDLSAPTETCVQGQAPAVWIPLHSRIYVTMYSLHVMKIHAVKIHVIMHDCIIIVLAVNIHICIYMYIYIWWNEDFIKSFCRIIDRLLIILQRYYLGSVGSNLTSDIWFLLKFTSLFLIDTTLLWQHISLLYFSCVFWTTKCTLIRLYYTFTYL